MIDLGCKLYMRRLERIFGGKADLYLEDAALKRTARRTKDRALPMEEILAYGSCAASSGRILL
jgi:hypothetical protein